MVQLQVLSGARVGQKFESKEFPISIGRDADCAFIIAEPGVFGRHLEIRFSSDGFSLAPIGEATVLLNGSTTTGELLRNGDIITAGYARLQFWLAAMPQRGLKIREGFTWLMVATVLAAQAYLLFRLLAMTRS